MGKHWIMGDFELQMTLNYEWLGYMGESWVCSNYGWLWIMDETLNPWGLWIWATLNFGWLWLIGDFELLVT